MKDRHLKQWFSVLFLTVTLTQFNPPSNALSQSNPLDAYYRFLNQNPQIQQAAHLQQQNLQTGPLSGVFQSSIYSLIQTNGQLPPVNPAEIQQLNGQVAQAMTPKSEYFLTRNLAFALWLELNHKVRWSLTSYTPQQLELILYYPKRPWLGDYYRFFISPDVAYRDWQQNIPHASNLSRRDTVLAMNQWIRDHIGHAIGEDAFSNGLQEGLHSYFKLTKPVSEELKKLNPQSAHLNLVGSCQNNNRFMAGLGSALNIPVYYSIYNNREDNPPMPAAGRHSFIDFTSEDLSLIHSDDLYSYSMLNQAPVSALFISGPLRSYFLRNAVFTDTSTLLGNPLEADKLFETHYTAILFKYPTPELKVAACEGFNGVIRLLDKKRGRQFMYEAEVEKNFQPYANQFKNQCNKPN